jgi:Protein of unknown function (DUF4232)
MHLPTRTPRRIVAATALACSAILLPAAALAAPSVSAAPAAPAAHAAIGTCPTSALEVWLGVGPGGATAGSTFQPLEFTNISHQACTEFGFPGVSAVRNSGRQIGRAAGRSGTPSAVTLQPGQTANASLQFTDVSNLTSAPCRPINAFHLKIFAPDQFGSSEISGFRFQACRGTSAGLTFLHVGPLQAGTGVPGFPGL